MTLWWPCCFGLSPRITCTPPSAPGDPSSQGHFHMNSEKGKEGLGDHQGLPKSPCPTTHKDHTTSGSLTHTHACNALLGIYGPSQLSSDVLTERVVLSYFLSHTQHSVVQLLALMNVDQFVALLGLCLLGAVVFMTFTWDILMISYVLSNANVSCHV